MALTKTLTAIQASTTPAAGATTTGSSINLTAGYGGELVWKITNGSAPTSTPSVEIQVSPDGTAWYRLFLVSGDLTASSVNSGAYPIGVGTMFLRSLVTSGATNGSTMIVTLEQITAY